MSSEELVAEFQKDYQNLERKYQYLVKEVRKKALRARNKYYTKMYEYKSPRKNTWLILVEYNNATPLILPIVYYLCDGKINAITKHPDKNSFTHYISHFFQRYNERFLKQEDLSTLDILKIFIPINSLGSYDLIEQEYSDETRVFARFKDGVGLGVYEKTNKYTIEYLKTYISSDMIGDWQQLRYDIVSKDFEEYLDEENEQLFS